MRNGTAGINGRRPVYAGGNQSLGGKKSVDGIGTADDSHYHFRRPKGGGMKTDDETLIIALRILEAEIQSDDGVANACITEAANRLEELTAGTIEIHKCIGVAVMMGETASTYSAQPIGIPEQTLRVRQ